MYIVCAESHNAAISCKIIRIPLVERHSGTCDISLTALVLCTPFRIPLTN